MFQIIIYANARNEVKYRFSGPLVRAFFLSIIRDHNENIAQSLHNPTGIASYSIRPLSKISKEHEKTYHNDLDLFIQQGDRVRFSISFLSRELARGLGLPLVDLLFKKREIKIGNGIFEISSAKLKRLEFEKLNTNKYRFFVRFRTPTFFRRMGNPYHSLLPSPRDFFLSIAKIWNSFSEKKFSLEDLENMINTKIGITSVNIRSSKVINLSNNRSLKGFTGTCVYETNEKEMGLIVSKLLSIARFTNVGGSRTLGFGVIDWKLLEETKSESNTLE